MGTQSTGLTFAGVGNIHGAIYTPAVVFKTISMNGIVGYDSPRIQEFEYACSSSSLLVLHSVALSRQCNLSRPPGLIQRHPWVIAGVLYRNHHREHADATVATLRLGLPGPLEGGQ